MTEDRDPYLQSVFDDNQTELTEEEFVQSVMARTVRLRRNLYLCSFVAFGFILIVSWLMSWPLADIGLAFSQVLGTELVELGDSVISLLLIPVNNLATLLVIVWRIARRGWVHAAQGSYSS